jgi:hypothetical protein
MVYAETVFFRYGIHEDSWIGVILQNIMDVGSFFLFVLRYKEKEFV